MESSSGKVRSRAPAASIRMRKLRDDETFRSQYAMMLQQLKHLDTSMLQETDIDSEYVLNLSEITSASKCFVKAFENESVIDGNVPLHSTVINAPTHNQTESRRNNTPNSSTNDKCGRYSPCGSNGSSCSLGEGRNIDILLNTSLSTFNYNGQQLCANCHNPEMYSTAPRNRQMRKSQTSTEQYRSGYSSKRNDFTASSQYTSEQCEPHSEMLQHEDTELHGLSMNVNTSFTICEDDDTSFEGYEIDLDEMETPPRKICGEAMTQSCASSVWSPEMQQADYVNNYMLCDAINRQQTHIYAVPEQLQQHARPVFHDVTDTCAHQQTVSGAQTFNSSSDDYYEKPVRRQSTTHRNDYECINHYMMMSRPTPEGKEATPTYNQMSRKNLKRQSGCSPVLAQQKSAKIPLSSPLRHLTEGLETVQNSYCCAPQDKRQSQYCVSAKVHRTSQENVAPESWNTAQTHGKVDVNNTMLSTVSSIANQNCKMVCVPVKFKRSKMFKKMRKIGKKVNEGQEKPSSQQGKTVRAVTVGETTFQMLGSV